MNFCLLNQSQDIIEGEEEEEEEEEKDVELINESESKINRSSLKQEIESLKMDLNDTLQRKLEMNSDTALEVSTYTSYRTLLNHSYLLHFAPYNNFDFISFHCTD